MITRVMRALADESGGPGASTIVVTRTPVWAIVRMNVWSAGFFACAAAAMNRRRSSAVRCLRPR